jgi:plasmid stability protein
MPNTYSSRTADKFVVRLPDGMREDIARRARENGRSMNSEMIMMMRAQLAPGAQQPEPLADAARSLIDMVQAELGERTAEQREQEYKFAVEEFMTGRGLPSNAMELVIRGRTGVGKSTVLNNLMHGLQSLLNSAPKIGLGRVPMVYLIQGDTSFRALLEVADGHERVVFVRDFEQESR